MPITLGSRPEESQVSSREFSPQSQTISDAEAIRVTTDLSLEDDTTIEPLPTPLHQVLHHDAPHIIWIVSNSSSDSQVGPQSRNYVAYIPVPINEGEDEDGDGEEESDDGEYEDEEEDEDEEEYEDEEEEYEEDVKPKKKKKNKKKKTKTNSATR